MKKRGRWDDSSDDSNSADNDKSKIIKDNKQQNKVKDNEASLKYITNESINIKSDDNVNNELIQIQNNLVPSTSTTTTATIPKHFNPDNSIRSSCRSVEEYQKISFISQGTYGFVYKAKCLQTNDIVALKEIKLTADAKKVGFPVTALRETNILLSLSHPNIIRVREMVIGSSLDKVYMVMDYYDYDLKTCMDLSRQTFATSEVKQLLIQLLSAIEHMHSRWYLHRDLKTSNLLYSNTGRLCVCDFGLARKYGSPIAPYTFEVVTLWYRAPELLLGSKVYSTPLDMWSIGCIFAEMLTGKPLFPGQGVTDEISLIFKALGAPNEDIWPNFSNLPNASKVSWKTGSRGKMREMFPTASFSGGVYLNDSGFNLLSRLLHMDPKQRISASDALMHPWLVSEDPQPCPPDRMPIFLKKENHVENNSSDKS